MSYLLGFSTLVSGRENYWLVNIQSSVCGSCLWFCWARRKRKSKPVWRKNDGYSLNASNLVKEIKRSIFLVSNIIGLFLSYLIPVYVLGPQVELVLYKVVMKMVIRFDLIYKSLCVRNLSSDIGKWSHLGGCLGHWGAPFTGGMNGFAIWERAPSRRVNAASIVLLKRIWCWDAPGGSQSSF